MVRDRPRALPALRHRRAGVAARFVAGPRVDDALRVAGELVRAGRRVAFDHLPPRSADAAAELAALVARVATAGLSHECELTVPLDRLGTQGARQVARAALESGLGVCLLGPGTLVDRLAAGLPGARTAVLCGDPGAEERARGLAGRPVRLVAGRGSAADRALVRCLNVLMPASGPLSVATSDLRLVAVTGERAIWYDRPPGSWEHLMSFGVRTAEQQRLVAAGATVRVAVPSGTGAAGLLVRRMAGAA
jgi:proline dehydrogenase